MRRAKELVSLKQRQLESGTRTLYLEYTIGGHRVRKSLNMYLVPGSDPITRQKNANTLRLAQLEQSRVLLELQCDMSPLGVKKIVSKRSVTSVFREYIEKKENEGILSHRRILEYKTVLYNWLQYAGEFLTFEELNRNVLLGFVTWMRKKGLSQNTIAEYFTSIFNHFLSDCERDGIITQSPMRKISSSEKPHSYDPEKPFLVFDEVNVLINTPCRREEVKKAFLFCCFTGLRWSDVSSLKWENIQDEYIVKVLVKTQRINSNPKRIPISENAKRFMPDKGKASSSDLVFNLPPYRTVHDCIVGWGQAAKLTKHLTFHMARHTCATLLLTYGADLYTVSKILGHTNIQTTQVYAKVIDEKKVEAVNLIPEV